MPDGAGLRAKVELARGALLLDVEVDVAPGEVVVVVGPNGAGKTTLLRALAGLLPLEGGDVRLGPVVLDDVANGRHVPPERRATGVVFQEMRLFPHLSALENVAFGLRASGAGRRAARDRADAGLAAVGLAGREHDRPARLSGGQAQRVALARALAGDPALLLLDEPLSALDVQTRSSVRAMLTARLAAFGGATLLVTHDPLDALVLADRILVLEQGQVVQVDAPAAVAARPRSAYVARLMGLNLLSGELQDGLVRLPGGRALVTATRGSGPVNVALRPSAVAVHRERPGGSPRNVWLGTVTSAEHTGSLVRVMVDGDPALLADVTPAAVAELGLFPGVEVWVAVKATELDVYAADDTADVTSGPWPGGSGTLDG